MSGHMSARDRSGRGRSRWDAEDDMDVSNSDDERKSRALVLRDGILFPHSNYYQFLIKWVAEMCSKFPNRPKVLKESITQATHVERDRINLPEHEKISVVHCDITVKGLPPFSFCGSGYGSAMKTAYFAAAKDFMDKCLKMGIVTRDLHEAIGNKPVLEMNRRLPDFPRSLEAIHQLDSRIIKASWRDNIDETRNLVPTDFAQLDQFIAESREAVYGRDAPVYDPSFCGLCKRKSHTETCPYGLEEKRLDKLRRAQEERQMDRRDRRGRSRSRSREGGRDAVREEKEKERMEIERKIMEQREALAREDEDRKLKEATEKARAAALAFGGGGIPMMGGPGAAPLVTPGLSGAANPIGMMMHSSSPQSQYMNPFHPLNPVGPSPEMMASMAHFTSMAGGYGHPSKEPVTVPTGYAAHVQALEEQRMRTADEMARRAVERGEMERRAVMEREEMERRAAIEREREEMNRRETAEAMEARLRAEMEARLHEEIEQKRREMEMELMEKLAPMEARKLGRDFGAAMNTYVNLSTSTPVASMSINPYGGMSTAQQSLNSYSQPSSYGEFSSGSNGLNAPPNPYAAASSSMQPMQLPMSEMPEFAEIKKLVNDNTDTLKNLAYARDHSLATHPVLLRVGGLRGGNVLMSQMELRELRDELKDFLAMLMRRAEDGRARVQEEKKDVKMDRRRRRSRSRSRSRSRERRGDARNDRRRGGDGGGGWNSGKREDFEEVEVIVEVGGNRFRQLREKEAMKLKRDDIVVAQDLKSGKWSTAKVLKVSDRRVQLIVGNAVWKKEFNEVYTPL